MFSRTLTFSILYDCGVILFHTNEVRLVQDFISQSNRIDVNTGHFQSLGVQNGCLAKKLLEFVQTLTIQDYGDQELYDLLMAPRLTGRNEASSQIITVVKKELLSLNVQINR